MFCSSSSLPEENVGEGQVSMDGRMRGLKECMLESRVDKRRGERKDTNERMPVHVRWTVRSLSLSLGNLAPYQSIISTGFQMPCRD